MYRPSFRQLEYVVALDDLRHFGQAAARCRVSQPTLSMQLALLERNLAAILFDRGGAAVAPTPLGAEIAHRARMILSQLDDVVQLAATDADRLGGLIRLGTAPSLGPYFLPTLLRRVHFQHPDLKLYISEDRPVDVERAVQEGAIDCALGPTPDAEGLEFRGIGMERIWVGVSAQNPLARRMELRLADLAGARFLSLGAGHRLSESLHDLARAAGAEIVADYEGTSLDSIRQMVEIDMGLSIFPDLYARAEFREGDGVALKRVADWSGRRDFGFYWRTGAGRRPHFEALAREAVSVAVELGVAGGDSQ